MHRTPGRAHPAVIRATCWTPVGAGSASGRGGAGPGPGERARRRAARARQRICIPEIAREMTSRWISEVPSKMV